MNKNLKAALSGNLDEYKSIPFWSWNNHLDEKVLVRQIEEMKEAGIGGFIMHARTGLKDEYLGEKWFSCIAACLAKAKELGMEAWAYDENGWPSGFVGGKLLENEKYLAHCLGYSVGDFDASAFVSYIETDSGYIRTEEKVPGITEYHNVYLRTCYSNTDILNAEVVDAFIAETHEKYYERFKDSFGKELAGFFTDEPQYFRWATPYTPCAAAAFEKDGEDIRDGLIWLFVHDERGYAFREKYYKELNRLYVDVYYKKLYDWCEAHGCKLTGHSVEENALFSQMWGGAAVMPTYEFEHIPGIDWLGRNCGNEIAPRQVGSAVAQLGQKFVLSESFGCSGYDVTPRELKSIGDYQYFNGVNRMCHHLYPYSIANQGKVDHPPVFGPHGNWFKEFKTFNEYFNRLSYIVANTQDRYDVAILHPMRDVWTEYCRGVDYLSVKEKEESFNELLKELRKHGVTFHFIDERLLERHGSIEKNGALRVGKCVYDKIIVPKMRTLSATTYGYLKKFKGKLCVLGDIRFIDGVPQKVSLRQNATLEEMLSSARVKYACEDGNSVLTARSGEIGDFLFIKNLSRTEESRVQLQGVAENYRALDLETLTEADIADDMVICPSGSVVLIKDEKARPAAVSEKTEDVTANFRVTGISENYLVLDYGEMSCAGAPYGDRRAVTGLFDELLRKDYKGPVQIRQTFNLREAMPLKLIMEKAEYKSVAVNGKDITFAQSAFDVNFMEAEIGGIVRAGENELVYSLDFWEHDGVSFALFDPRATETLRNCLYFDVSLEPAYLKGDFIVGEDLSLSKRNALPAVTSSLYRQGYPFFKGELTLEGKIRYSGAGKVLLGMEGRFMAADIEANGKQALLMLNAEKDISDILTEGDNDVKIVLRSSLRNLFGPHHFVDPEPLSVGPFHFTFRAEWEDGKNPPNYTDEYHSVPFGADKIVLIHRKEK